MEKIRFEAFCIVDDSMWVSAMEYNALFKVNLKTHDVGYISQFPQENPLGQRLHYGEQVFFNGKIYFMPLFAKNLHIFDINKNEFEILSHKIENQISNSFFYENRIIMTSPSSEQILIYDIERDAILEQQPSEKGGYSLGGYMYNGKLFLALTEKNILRSIDCMNGKMEDYELELGNSIIVGGVGDEIVLSVRGKELLYVWNIQKKKITRTHSIKSQIELCAWQIGEIAVGNKLNCINDYVIVDLKTLEAENIVGEKIKDGISSTGILSCFSFGEQIYIHTDYDGAIRKLNTDEIFSFESGNVDKQRLSNDIKAHKDLWQAGDVIKETEVVSLEKLLQIL